MAKETGKGKLPPNILGLDTREKVFRDMEPRLFTAMVLLRVQRVRASIYHIQLWPVKNIARTHLISDQPTNLTLPHGEAWLF